MQTQAELEEIYAQKMLEWTDARLIQEMGFVADRANEGNECWGKPEVMAAWKKCLLGEAERRSPKSSPAPKSAP